MDKKYLLNVLIYFLSGMLAIALIVFTVYHLAGLDSREYTTAPALRVKAEIGFEGEAYSFRDEVPLCFKGDGMAYCSLREGENVRVGKELGGVYLPSAAVKAQLLQLDRLETAFEQAQEKQTLGEANAAVRAAMTGIRASGAAGDARGFSSLCDELLISLDRRTTASGGRIDYDYEKGLIAKQREALMRQLGKRLQVLTAPVSGNFSSVCDGYEEAFVFEKAENLGPDSFEKLIAAATPVDLSSHAGKIVASSGWRLVMETDAENAVSMAVGGRYAVRASTGEELDLTLEAAVSDPATEKTLLTFFSRVMPETPIGRCDRVKVIREVRQGLMIPGGAIRCVKDENGLPQICVYVLRGNKITRKNVDIVTKEEGSFIVRDYTGDGEHKGYLLLNDLVITSGREIEEGYSG